MLLLLNDLSADLKPQNIFVAVDPSAINGYTCKLFDFGCSRLDTGDVYDEDTSYENAGVS